MMATDVSEKGRLEGQLLQAQKIEAIGRLTGGVAHDFDTSQTRPGIKALFMSRHTNDAIGRHGVPEAGIHLLQKLPPPTRFWVRSGRPSMMLSSEHNGNDTPRSFRALVVTPCSNEGP